MKKILIAALSVLLALGIIAPSQAASPIPCGGEVVCPTLPCGDQACPAPTQITLLLAHQAWARSAYVTTMARPIRWLSVNDSVLVYRGLAPTGCVGVDQSGKAAAEALRLAFKRHNEGRDRTARAWLATARTEIAGVFAVNACGAV